MYLFLPGAFGCAIMSDAGRAFNCYGVSLATRGLQIADNLVDSMTQTLSGKISRRDQDTH